MYFRFCTHQQIMTKLKVDIISPHLQLAFFFTQAKLQPNLQANKKTAEKLNILI